MEDPQESLESSISESGHEKNDVELPENDMSEPLLSAIHNDEDDVEESASHEDTETLTSYKGPMLLLLVAFFYATLNVSLRSLYLLPNPPAPSAVSSSRGWIAALCFLPLMWNRKRQSQTIESNDIIESGGTSVEVSGRPLPLWMAAAELAVWNFLTQASYNIGLLTTPSARASFLGQTTVVMVPLLCSLTGKPLRRVDALGCLLSLVGVVLLQEQREGQATPTSTQDNFGIGDVFILLGAFLWSCYLLRISTFAPHYDEVYLQGTKNAYLAVLYTLWWAVSFCRSDHALWVDWRSPTAWSILVYSAVGPGTIADLIQQKGQETVSPTESNLILCVESVFTTLLSRFLLGEETTWMEKLGGLFLVAGAVTSGS